VIWIGSRATAMLPRNAVTGSASRPTRHIKLHPETSQLIQSGGLTQSDYARGKYGCLLITPAQWHVNQGQCTVDSSLGDSCKGLAHRLVPSRRMCPLELQGTTGCQMPHIGLPHMYVTWARCPSACDCWKLALAPQRSEVKVKLNTGLSPTCYAVTCCCLAPGQDWNQMVCAIVVTTLSRMLSQQHSQGNLVLQQTGSSCYKLCSHQHTGGGFALDHTHARITPSQSFDQTKPPFATVCPAQGPIAAGCTPTQWFKNRTTSLRGDPQGSSCTC
jgi:hypothetical protein